MSHSLLAHLYPRIKGSQEDIATFSLGYILEQSSLLNECFTKLISNRLNIKIDGNLKYRCQDADSEFGRPDIAAYQNGQLKIFCEAKFYAGLTENQPVSYLKRLSNSIDSGLLFICPRNRIISLWGKIRAIASNAGYQENIISETSVCYNNVYMAIISWSEVLSELIRVAMAREPEYLGDLKQLEGFYLEIENESFIPFRPEEFGAQIASDIDRYYHVIDEVFNRLNSHKELNPQTKGLRKSPQWQGYTSYIRLNNFGVSVAFLRNLWKRSTSIETPFWCFLKEIQNGKWVLSERLSAYYASLDATTVEEYYGDIYIALIPKPYLTLEETANDLTNQIIQILQTIEEKFGE